jgi:glycerol-3-phosphate acyltransferase PlsY
MAFVLAALVGYVLGSILFAILFLRLWHPGEDISRHGSGNPGFTNVFRVYGTRTGVWTLIGDIGKGALAVAIARYAIAPRFDADSVAVGLVAALASVLGHALPVFHRFKGGKGVATASGAFAVLTPAALGAASVVFFLTLVSLRFMSLASMLGAIALAAWLTWFTGEGSSTTLTVVGWFVAGAIVLRHRSNVGTLLRGTESRFTFKRS